MAKVDRLLKKARAQRKKGRGSRALELYREACEEAPHDPEVWLERAGVAEEANGKEEAVAALFHAADLYARAGLSGEAAEISERVLEMNPKHGGARRFVRMMRGRDRPRAAKKAVKERPPKAKPAKEEPAEEKAAAAVAAAKEEPVGEKAVAAKPAKEEPVGEKAVAAKPAKEEPEGEKAARKKAGKEEPAEEKPVEEKAAAEKEPAADKPEKKKEPEREPAEEKPAEEKVAKKKAAADAPAEEAAVVKAASKGDGAGGEEFDYDSVSIEERKPAVAWTHSLVEGADPEAAPEEPAAVEAALRARAKATARAEAAAPPTVEHRMGRVTGEIALGDLSLAAMVDDAEAGAASEFPLDDEGEIHVLHAVAATITSSPLLSELDSDLVKYLIDCGRVRRCLKGKAVFMEGESGTSLFLILEGALRVERNDPDTGRVRRLATLRRGAFFGEMALITDAPRSATVRASRDATLLEVSREEVLKLIKRESRVLKLLMRFFRARLVGNLLATSPLFTDFDIDARRQIVRQFRLRELPGGHIVLEKGQRSDGLYLVLAGDLVAYLPDLEGGEQLLGELGPGDVFGEMSLLEGTTAMASIRALVRSWVLRLPRDEFAQLVAVHPLLLEQLSDIAEARRQANIETLRSTSVRPV